MGNALVTLILVAVVLVGVLTLATGSISSLDMISDSWKQMEGQVSERSRTQIDCVSLNVTDDGSMLCLTVENKGQVSLGDFSQWDVIVRYYDGGSDYYAKWLPYTSSTPDDNQWTVEGIYFQGDNETIEPGIFNPGEELEVIARLSPAVGWDTVNTATVSTPSGVSCHIIFRYGVTDIAITKTVDNPTPRVGKPVTFTVTATNNGPSDATGVKVSDALPDGLTYVSHTVSQGSYNPATGVWDVGAIVSGGNATLDIVATATEKGMIANTATKTDVDQYDPVTSNDSDSAVVDVK